jgi:voltage-gated potassium channel
MPTSTREPRSDEGESPRRVRRAVGLLGIVLVVGTIGYMVLGLAFVDAAYQTVTTVSTVGFRELGAPTTAWKVFTMVLVLGGTGTVLYTIGALFELVLDGALTDRLGRRRMERDLSRYRDHVIVCGYGRVGHKITSFLVGAGRDLVVVDRDPDRLRGLDVCHVVGDGTDDAVLRHAGIERASTLIAAFSTDADNLYITLSARSLRPDLFIVARARVSSAEPKLRQAGADRVVNPQAIGGERIAALTLQPHVADFLDVVMHDGSLEFRLEEITIPAECAVAGRSLRDAHIRDRTGALVLAIRRPDGSFVTNPDPETAIERDVVLITVGTREQQAALAQLVSGGLPS